MFDVIKRFSTPIYILFFVLVGAQLDARILVRGGVLILALGYVISRSIGKVAGAYIGGKLSQARQTVTKYLGFCLFDQAGVAVGLAIASFNMLSYMGEEARAVGYLIINIVTATTFLLQIIAPPMIKLGIKKADEIGRNVTEEDIIETYKIKDVMDTEFFTIKENSNLHEVIDIMKRSDSYTFPVVGMDGNFQGVISLGEIRETFYEEQMDQLILAGDLVRDPGAVIYEGQGLKDAMNMFRISHADYIPILRSEDDKKLVGQLEYRKITDYITKEVLLRQQELET
jgi:CBS domain-containing protein